MGQRPSMKCDECNEFLGLENLKCLKGCTPRRAKGRYVKRDCTKFKPVTVKRLK